MKGARRNHKNNAGNARVKIVADVHNLLVNLARRKRTGGTSSSACCTESTAMAQPACVEASDQLIAGWHANTRQKYHQGGEAGIYGFRLRLASNLSSTNAIPA